MLLAILLFLVLGAVIGNEYIPDDNTGVKEGTFPKNQDLHDFLKEKQDASKFTTNIIPYATYNPETNILNLKVANPERNSIDCLIRIKIGDDIYYESPLLKPNQYLDEIEPDKPLPADQSKMYVMYTEILPDGDYRTLTTVEVKYDIKGNTQQSNQPDTQTSES